MKQSVTPRQGAALTPRMVETGLGFAELADRAQIAGDMKAAARLIELAYVAFDGQPDEQIVPLVPRASRAVPATAAVIDELDAAEAANCSPSPSAA